MTTNEYYITQNKKKCQQVFKKNFIFFSFFLNLFVNIQIALVPSRGIVKLQLGDFFPAVFWESRREKRLWRGVLSLVVFLDCIQERGRRNHARPLFALGDAHEIGQAERDDSAVFVVSRSLFKFR